MTVVQKNLALVAEKNISLARLHAKTLQEVGWEVEVYCDGQHVWKRLSGEETMPALLLIDVILPGKVGHSVIWCCWFELNVCPRIVALAENWEEQKTYEGTEGVELSLRKPIPLQYLKSIGKKLLIAPLPR